MSTDSMKLNYIIVDYIILIHKYRYDIKLYICVVFISYDYNFII